MAGGRVVIVGGGSGGDAAAFALRKKGYDGEVVIVSADVDRPYDRPYLSKEFMRGEVELDKVFLHGVADYEREGIALRLGTRVNGGSLGERRLELSDGSALDFETLVLSLGGTPRSVPGGPPADNVFRLRTLEDAKAIRDAVRDAGRLLLVGAGFIGAEVAASARLLGKDVLIVEAAPVPLARALGEDVGRVYASIHRDHGVDLRTGVHVAEWKLAGNRVTSVELSDGHTAPVDVALVAVGIDPNLALPQSLAMHVEPGGVPVDGRLVSREGVYAGGDIALHDHPIFGPIRVEHWEVAKGHGRAIAAQIVGEHSPYARLPYFWSDQYDVSLEYRGHASGGDAAVWRGDVTGRTFSVFYLRDGKVRAVLSMNDKDGGKTGAQLIESGVDVDEKRLGDPGTDLRDLLPPS